MDGKSIRNKLIGSDDERAVSPVIGVVLMVAVTVILAAVIAAFVMDMGSGMGDGSAPTVGTEVSTNSDWDETKADQEYAYVSHQSGDTIEGGNLKVVLRDDNGGTIGTVESDGTIAVGSSGGEYEVDVFLNGANDISSEDFSGGSTLRIETTSASENAFYDTSEVTIQFIHKPSDSTVVEHTVDA